MDNNEVETRFLNMMLRSPGGNASKTAIGYRLTIPTSWAIALGCSPDDRSIKATFDGQKIIIEKSSSPDK